MRSYLHWAAEAVRMLRSTVSSEDVDRLVLTRRYWSLQSGVPGRDMVPLLVGAELDERIEQLAAAKVWVEDLDARWSRGRLVVLDTSAFIHGTYFEEWDLAQELGIRGQHIQIVEPIIVLDELDRLKEASGVHARTRARRTLSYLARQLESSEAVQIRRGRVEGSADAVVISGDVWFEVLLEERGHVRLPLDDDEIVDQAVLISQMTGRDVTLVTNDTAQAHRARMTGLEIAIVQDPIYEDEAAAQRRQYKEQRSTGR